MHEEEGMLADALTEMRVKLLKLPIEGRTIATGRFPASFSNILSASAFVKVYVFGRSPMSDDVNYEKRENNHIMR